MTKDEPSDHRLKEAMGWLLRLREAPDDPDLRGDVEAWLAADPDRLSAWNRARRTWQIMGDLPPTTAGAWERQPQAARVTRPRPARHARAAKSERASSRPWRGRTALTAAALAAAACLVLIFGSSLALRLQADHVTAAGETRQVALADGSVVYLAPQSAIDLRFTDDRRSLALLRGDAFFEVTPDPQRPFVVDADGLRAQVIGTAFGVSLSAVSVDVEVESGAVGVRSDATLPPIDLRLNRGQTLHIDRETEAALLDRKAPDDIATWRHGELLVVDASIAEVVEELRRYYFGWIVIADDRMAARRVNGIYDLRNPDNALRALVHPAGGQVHEITPLLRVLR